MAGGYTPTTHGGAVASTGTGSGATNPFSSDKSQYSSGDFAVVTDPNGGPRHQFAHEPLPGDPHDPVTSQASDLVHSLIGKSPGEIATLQQALITAGYMPKSAGVSGVVDNDTRQAYAQLLQETSSYNQAGQNITPDDMLANKAAGLAASAAAGVGKAPRVGSIFRTANPLDINQTAQQVAQQELGRKLNPKQLAQFVAVYHGIEAHKNSQVAASDPTTQAGGDVSIQSAPSVSAAADNYVQQNFAGEYGAANVANTFDSFRKLIS